MQIVVPLLLSCLGLAVPVESKCDAGWVGEFEQGFCYKFTQSLTYWEAEKYCLEQNSRLWIVLEDGKEKDEVKKVYDYVKVKDKNTKAWLGYTMSHVASRPQNYKGQELPKEIDILIDSKSFGFKKDLSDFSWTSKNLNSDCLALTSDKEAEPVDCGDKRPVVCQRIGQGDFSKRYGQPFPTLADSGKRCASGWHGPSPEGNCYIINDVLKERDVSAKCPAGSKMVRLTSRAELSYIIAVSLQRSSFFFLPYTKTKGKWVTSSGEAMPANVARFYENDDGKDGKCSYIGLEHKDGKSDKHLQGRMYADDCKNVVGDTICSKAAEDRYASLNYRCPWGWVGPSTGFFCYQIQTDSNGKALKADNFEAEVHCAKKDARLPEWPDKNSFTEIEGEFMYNVAREFEYLMDYKVDNSMEFHMGFWRYGRLDSELDKFQGDYGSALDVNAWANNEPGGEALTERCVSWRVTMKKAKDDKCPVRKYVICQKYASSACGTASVGPSFEGWCYSKLNGQVDYAKAKADCVAAGGSLPRTGSRAEMAFAIVALNKLSGAGDFFVDLYDNTFPYKEEYRDSLELLPTFTAWNWNEPNKGTEQCVVVYQQLYKNYVDISCQSTHTGLCIKAPPCPAGTLGPSPENNCYKVLTETDVLKATFECHGDSGILPRTASRAELDFVMKIGKEQAGGEDVAIMLDYRENDKQVWCDSANKSLTVITPLFAKEIRTAAVYKPLSCVTTKDRILRDTDFSFDVTDVSDPKVLLCQKPKLCPTIAVPANGKRTYKPHRSVSDYVVFTCDTGYSLIGSSKFYCLPSGDWWDSPPVCEVKRCPTIGPPMSNATANYTSSEREYLSEATLSCPLKYFLGGQLKLTCNANAEWKSADNKGPTSCYPQKCDKLPEVEHGSIDYTAESLVVDTMAKFTCDHGYIVEGVENRTCLVGGVWEDVPNPTCKLVVCDVRPKLDNGRITYSKDNRTVDTVVTFSCNNGFRKEGSTTLECSSPGRWLNSIKALGENPECILQSCEWNDWYGPSDDNFCYYYPQHLPSLNYFAAEAYCMEAGGKLPELNSFKERIFLADLSELHLKEAHESIWLDYNDYDVSHRLVKTDSGQEVGYFQSEPDDEGNEVDCRYMQLRTGNGRGDDIPGHCARRRATVCQRPKRARTCPAGWIGPSFSGFCYSFYGKASWIGGQNHCMAMNGSLPKIPDRRELVYIVAQLDKIAHEPSPLLALDYNDAVEEGTFRDSGGERIPFFPFKEGRPLYNKYHSCLFADLATDYRYLDDSCCEVTAFIACQVEACCPSPGNFFGDLSSSCYSIENSPPLTWKLAQEACANKSGTLFTVESPVKEWELSTFLSKNIPLSANAFWIGARGNLNGGFEVEYEMVNGSYPPTNPPEINGTEESSPCTGMAWFPSLSNNFTGGEPCLSGHLIRNYESALSNMIFWSEGACATRRLYICQYESVCGTGGNTISCRYDGQEYVTAAKLCLQPERPLTVGQLIAANTMRFASCLFLVIMILISVVLFIAYRAFDYERWIHMWQEITLLIAHCFLAFMSDRVKDELLCTISCSALIFFFTAFFVFLFFDALHCHSYTTAVFYKSAHIDSRIILTVFGLGLAGAVTGPTVWKFRKELPAPWVCWINVDSPVHDISLGVVCLLVGVSMIIVEAAGISDNGSLPLVNPVKLLGIRISRGWLFPILPVAFGHWYISALMMYHQELPLYMAEFVFKIALPILLFLRDITRHTQIRHLLYRFLMCICPCLRERLQKRIDSENEEVEDIVRKASHFKNSEEAANLGIKVGRPKKLRKPKPEPIHLRTNTTEQKRDEPTLGGLRLREFFSGDAAAQSPLTDEAALDEVVNMEGDQDHDSDGDSDPDELGGDGDSDPDGLTQEDDDSGTEEEEFQSRQPEGDSEPGGRKLKDMFM